MKQLAIFLPVLLAMILNAGAAFGGGWVSTGGGELFRDAHNPWFLKNVAQVNYCVKVASQSVSATAETARSVVREAIAYWKAEFTRVNGGFGAGQFTLGTQNFAELSCDDANVDLRFLIGYESLSQDERGALQDPTRFIGNSMRGDYGDAGQPVEKQMRGRGFIYVSSDFGPKAYHEGKDTTLLPRAWEHPKLLKLVVMHELGHIFGLPHVGTGLMAETFLEQSLNHQLWEAFEKIEVPSFFSPPDQFSACDQLTPAGRTWLAMAADENCAVFKKADGLNWEIFTAKGATDEPGRKIGTLKMATPELTDLKAEPAVILKLIDGQKVFDMHETLFRTFMFGPKLIQVGAKANLIFGPGQVKPAYLRISHDSFILQGASSTSGKIDIFVSYASPLGLLLLRDPTPPRGLQEKPNKMKASR